MNSKRFTTQSCGWFHVNFCLSGMAKVRLW